MKKKILLPLDGSDRDLMEVNFIKENFNPEKTEVILLNVGEVVYVEGAVVAKLIMSEQENSSKILERAAENLKGFQCIKKFQFGYADNIILDCADEFNVDMIVMAKNTKKKFIQLVGSVTSKVIKRAKCSVLMLPQV